MTTPFFTKLLVLDQEASASFYETLGFNRVGTDGTFIHLRWEEQGDVMLVGAPTGVQVGGKRGWGVLICFASKTPLEQLLERAQKLNAPTEGPDAKPWHTRELVVTDPDGYRLNFLQPIAT
ncbi:MAG: VOC family protein [Archangium sp.]